MSRIELMKANAEKRASEEKLRLEAISASDTARLLRLQFKNRFGYWPEQPATRPRQLSE